MQHLVGIDREGETVLARPKGDLASAQALSAITGQGRTDPRGVMVPRSYPVSCRATSASGMDNQADTQQSTQLRPGDSTVAGHEHEQEVILAAAHHQHRLTTSAGVTPRARATSARLRTGIVRITRWLRPRASAATIAGVDTAQYRGTSQQLCLTYQLSGCVWIAPGTTAFGGM